MSQIGGKMSKFYGETDIVSTDLHTILSNFVATYFYALFNGPSEKSSPKLYFLNYIFQTELFKTVILAYASAKLCEFIRYLLCGLTLSLILELSRDDTSP